MRPLLANDVAMYVFTGINLYVKCISRYVTTGSCFSLIHEVELMNTMHVYGKQT